MTTPFGQIPGKLLDGKAVEWFVLIEGVDDIIPVGPGVHVLVAVETDRVGVAMLTANTTSFNRPGAFVLDDWR